MAGTPPDGGSDRSLLDRLNALKPTSVALDKDKNLLDVSPSSLGQTGPSSREDDLTARLRTLRNRPESADRPSASGSGNAPSIGAKTTIPTDAGVEAQPPAAAGQSTPGTSQRGVPVPSTSPFPPVSTSSAAARLGDDEDAADVLFASDDHALDELLEGLEFDAGADEDQWDFSYGADSDAKKVSALLERLEKTSSLDPPARHGEASAGKSRHHDDSDDSEGEEMSRDVEEVLAQARADAELGRKLHPKEGEMTSAAPSGPDAEAKEAEQDDRTPKSQTSRIDVGDHGDQSDKLTLPTVPSKLVDPLPPLEANAEQDRESIDFENDITTRLAALKGLGKGINTDSFGLPSAPTFQPEDRPVPGVVKKAGYSDEDAKTWCIVCLEDASVRCIGCDDDVFCARCWREYHVGPRAGYDERGHQWAKFVK